MKGGARAADPDRLGTMRTLAVDRVTAEVIRALDGAGIPAILLKGPSIARWLYPDGGRTYRDTDLLVHPGRFTDTEAVLRSLGFRGLLDEFHPAERAVEAHGTTYARSRPGAPGRTDVVDLHRSLPGVGAGDRVWDTLAARTNTLVIGDTEARVLDPPCLALHIAVHAVQHAFGDHTDEDLRRALATLPPGGWQHAAEVARRLGIEEVLGFGLRRHPDGAAIADALGLPAECRTGSPHWWRASRPPKGAQTLDQLWSAPNFVARARIVRWAVVPSPARLRYRDRRRPGGRSRSRRLATAYLQHWRWLARHIGPAARFVLRQRRRI